MWEQQFTEHQDVLAGLAQGLGLGGMWADGIILAISPKLL